MKKLISLCIIFLILTMQMTSALASVGPVQLNTALGVNSPVAGGFTASVKVDEVGAKLLTAAYNADGMLIAAAMSGSAATENEIITTSQLNVDTVDGITVKNYIWSCKNLRAVSAIQQSGQIFLDDVYVYNGKCMLNWQDNKNIAGKAGYVAYKNGEALPDELSANAASLLVSDVVGGDKFLIVAIDANGDAVTSSNSKAAVVLTVPQAPQEPDYLDGEASEEDKWRFTYTLSAEEGMGTFLKTNDANIDGGKSRWRYYESERLNADGTRPAGYGIRIPYGGGVGEVFSYIDDTGWVANGVKSQNTDALWEMKEYYGKMAMWTTKPYMCGDVQKARGKMYVDFDDQNFSTGDNLTLTFKYHGNLSKITLPNGTEAKNFAEITADGEWAEATVVIENATISDGTSTAGGEMTFVNGGGDLYIRDIQVFNDTKFAELFEDEAAIKAENDKLKAEYNEELASYKAQIEALEENLTAKYTGQPSFSNKVPVVYIAAASNGRAYETGSNARPNDWRTKYKKANGGTEYAGTATDPANNRYGWGEMLVNYLQGVTVDNRAVAGSSSTSFADKYDDIVKVLRPGDYVLISFGANDVGTVTVEEFEANITSMVRRAIEKGANPVLITAKPCLMNGVVEYSTTEGRGIYNTAAIALAEQYGLPYYDMAKDFADILNAYEGNEAYRDMIEEYTGTKEDFFSVDLNSKDSGPQGRRTHLSKLGADTLAKLIAENFKVNVRLGALANYIK